MNVLAHCAAAATVALPLLSCGSDKDGLQQRTPPAGHENHDHAHESGPAKPSATQQYTCPMHPEVITTAPGTCPKCGMKLVPKT